VSSISAQLTNCCSSEAVAFFSFTCNDHGFLHIRGNHWHPFLSFVLDLSLTTSKLCPCHYLWTWQITVV